MAGRDARAPGFNRRIHVNDAVRQQNSAAFVKQLMKAALWFELSRVV
jgi:hypothetical protein